MAIVYSNGSIEVSVSADITIYTSGTAKIYYQASNTGIAPVFYPSSSVINQQVTLTPGSGVDKVRIDADEAQVLYAVGSSDPVIVERIEGYQGAPSAQTTTATLTAADLLSGIITADQGASGAAAYTLPLATAMDTALPTFDAGDSFDFSLLNISTDGAEDATILTATGWTLVGSIAVQSNDAATSKSAGLFRVRKTAAGAYTLYRIA